MQKFYFISKDQFEILPPVISAFPKKFPQIILLVVCKLSNNGASDEFLYRPQEN